MAPARMQFDINLAPTGRRTQPREDDAPLRILLMADLGGARDRPLAARKPLAVDTDNFEPVLAKVAPRLRLELDGQVLELAFASLDDFHPDRLFARLPVFGALRRLRDEARDPSQVRRVAATLGLQPGAAAAAEPPPPAAAADAASDIERLLGRAPGTAVPPPTPTPAAGPAAVLERWLQDLVAPHVQVDRGSEERAVLAACDQALTALMRRVLHHPAFQSLEAAWLGIDRLVRGLELGESLQLFVLDATRDEVRTDLATHVKDMAASALHQQVCAPAGASADAQRWGLWVLDQTFGPAAEDVQALAALGAIAARAGVPLLAAAIPQAAGADSTAELARPRQWRAADDDALAYWQALRSSPMAASIGLVLPRVLLRLPYGADTDRIASFDFEEMPAERTPEAYLWGLGGSALALLVGQAFQESGWDMDPSNRLDLEDLPSHVYTEDGARVQQPGAELLLGEEAGQALLERGLMPLLSYRNRNAVRLLRWQSVADPAQPLRGLGR